MGKANNGYTNEDVLEAQFLRGTHFRVTPLEHREWTFLSFPTPIGGGHPRRDFQNTPVYSWSLRCLKKEVIQVLETLPLQPQVGHLFPHLFSNIL
jgi:hypothetical protein